MAKDKAFLKIVLFSPNYERDSSRLTGIAWTRCEIEVGQKETHCF
jgi:hypothetical protein